MAPDAGARTTNEDRMSEHPIPPLVWTACEHKRVETIAPGLTHCRACTTFWSQVLVKAE